MSIYKKFRSVGEPAVFGSLTSRYDQPTYVTFRLVFAQNRDINYNNAGNPMNNTLSYDTMPHPLFAEELDKDVSYRESYSAISYLMDANEYTRAEMLREFISRFNELQNNFQWYFQSIDGIDELLAVDHKYGQRVMPDKRIRINMSEGIDLRVSYLMNLYRKIVWDDTYQRWVLPDMMRYFTLRIYISEFRTFHYQNSSSATRKQSEDDIVLSMMDDILPTWIIECEQCEFDLESSKFNYLSSMTTTEVPDQGSVTISIKVGKIFEAQTYKMFKSAYLIDRAINGYDRLKSSDEVSGEKFDSTASNQNNNVIKFKNAGRIAQSTIEDGPTEIDHVSGLPFNENSNNTNTLNSAFTSRNTILGNAINSGTALARNYAEEWVNKLKVSEIPKLGLSVNEITSAIESKNVFTALAMYRKAISTVANALIDPSEKITEKIIDDSFSSFVNAMSKSVATEDRVGELAKAANLVLNDKGVWDAIKDYSFATDLTGSGEENVVKKIQGNDIYKNLSVSDRSLATDLDGAPLLTPTKFFSDERVSTATTSKLVL